MSRVANEVDIAPLKSEDLIRSLLTCDGKGERYKQKCLEELLKRERVKILTELVKETKELENN